MGAFSLSNMHEGMGQNGSEWDPCKMGQFGSLDLDMHTGGTDDGVHC